MTPLASPHPIDAPDARRSRSRRRIPASAVVALAILAGCGVKVGGPAAFGKAPATSGSTSSGRPPAAVPAGFQLVQRKGIDVTFAVPASWNVQDIDGTAMSAGAKVMAESNPGLAGIMAQGTGMYAGAKVVGAVGPSDLTGPQSAIAAQLTVGLQSIPPEMGDLVTRQFRTAGATHVSTASIAVPGLRADQRALRINLTLLIRGRKAEQHELLVPGPDGMVVIAVRASGDLADRILATVAVS